MNVHIPYILNVYELLYLILIPTHYCNIFIGGHAAYSDAIKLSDGFSEKVGTVEALSFFLFHTVLKTSKDFYESMR